MIGALRKCRFFRGKGRRLSLMEHKITGCLNFRFMVRGGMLCMALLMLWGCTKQSSSSRNAPQSSETAAFAKAEALFQTGDYAHALGEYQAYVARYPGHQTDAALMKMAAIYLGMGKDREAREQYQKILALDPAGRFAPPARVEMLAISYRQGDYQNFFAEFDMLDTNALPQAARVRVFKLAGDAYLASGKVPSAVRAYARGYAGAAGGGLLADLRGALDQLDDGEIQGLMWEREPYLPRGLLMFQLATAFFREGKMQEAKEALDAFSKEFPEHALKADAAVLKTRIEEKSLQRRAVGCLLPLTGAYANYGKSALQGIEFAFYQLRAQYPGARVELVVKDTGDTEAGVARAAQELEAFGVAAIIGPLAMAGPAAREAQRAGIPLIALTGKDDMAGGEYVFRNFMTPQHQVDTVVSYLMGLGMTRFAVLYPDEKYGETFMKLFRERVSASGGTLVACEAYLPGDMDFAGPIKKLAGRGPKAESGAAPFDALFIPDSAKKVGLILPQLAYYDVKNVTFAGTNLWHSDELIRMDRKNAQNAVIPDGFFAQSDLPRVRDFVSGFQAVYGLEPGFIEAVSYDTAAILFGILERPDVLSRNDIREKLIQMPPFFGVTGRTSFLPTGEVQKSLFLLQVKGGGFQELVLPVKGQP